MRILTRSSGAMHVFVMAPAPAPAPSSLITLFPDRSGRPAGVAAILPASDRRAAPRSYRQLGGQPLSLLKVRGKRLGGRRPRLCWPGAAQRGRSHHRAHRRHLQATRDPHPGDKARRSAGGDRGDLPAGIHQALKAVRGLCAARLARSEDRTLARQLSAQRRARGAAVARCGHAGRAGVLAGQGRKAPTWCGSRLSPGPRAGLFSGASQSRPWASAPAGSQRSIGVDSVRPELGEKFSCAALAGARGGGGQAAPEWC